MKILIRYCNRLIAYRLTRLGVRFELEDATLVVYQPDGERFATYVELMQQRDQERQRADRLAARLRELGIDLEAE
jgi:hypothetical protein